MDLDQSLPPLATINRSNTVEFEFLAKWCTCSHNIVEMYSNDPRMEDANSAATLSFIQALSSRTKQVEEDLNIKKTMVTVRWLTQTVAAALKEFFTAVSNSVPPKPVVLRMCMHEQVSGMEEGWLLASFAMDMMKLFAVKMRHPEAKFVASVIPSTNSASFLCRMYDSSKMEIMRDATSNHALTEWTDFLNAMGERKYTRIVLRVKREVPQVNIKHAIKHLDIFVDPSTGPVTEPEVVAWSDKVDCRILDVHFGGVAPTEAFQRWVLCRRFFNKPHWFPYVRWTAAGEKHLFTGHSESFTSVVTFVVGGCATKASAACKFLARDGDRAVMHRVASFALFDAKAKYVVGGGKLY